MKFKSTKYKFTPSKDNTIWKSQYAVCKNITGNELKPLCEMSQDLANCSPGIWPPCGSQC